MLMEGTMTSDNEARAYEVGCFLPGEEGITRRPRHIFLVVDASASMAGRRISSVNHAIREWIGEWRQTVAQFPGEEDMVRAIRFGDVAEGHAADPIPLEELESLDISDPGGRTNLGGALQRLAPALDVPPLPARMKAPVIALSSDGRADDDRRGGFADVLSKPCGERAIRMAVGIGDDVDMDVLGEFAGDGQVMRYTP